MTGLREDGRPIGVTTPGWFNIELCFPGPNAADVAVYEFEAVGFAVERLPNVDPDETARFLCVSKPAGTATLDELWAQASELAYPLGGSADEPWIAA